MVNEQSNYVVLSFPNGDSDLTNFVTNILTKDILDTLDANGDVVYKHTLQFFMPSSSGS